jgi:peptidoglycan/xylan/chitin deacetylase (PgdA/CDA1 family)
MRIELNSAPPATFPRAAANRPTSTEVAAPQDSVCLSGASPAEVSQAPHVPSMMARAGAVALTVAAGIAGLSGLAQAMTPVLAAPPQAPLASQVRVVEASTAGVNLFSLAQTPAVSSASPASQAVPLALLASQQAQPAKAGTTQKVPDSVKQLTPEFFKQLGDIGYNYNKIPKGQFVLTFDDGPNPKVTPKILDTLKEHKIQGAVFFVTGANAQRYPDLLKRIVAEGHVLGNHTWSHPDLTKVSQATVLSELKKTDAAVDKVLGYDYPLKLVRPPYGATNKSVLGTLHDKYGGKSVVWQVDSLDWRVQSDLRQGKKTTPLTDRIVSGVKAMDKKGNGGVILMHDIHSNTAKDLDKVLDTLEAKGYKMISILDVGKPASK